MSVILETKQLCKFYGAGENQVKAVNQVDIQIEQENLSQLLESQVPVKYITSYAWRLNTPTKAVLL